MHPYPLRIGDSVTTEGRDFEWDEVVSYVAIESAWRRGYGVARRALRGPKWVIPTAISRNSSSTVCRAFHSSSVTYLHADRRPFVFLGGGDGNRGFFVVLREVVDDEVGPGLVPPPREPFHNRGGQALNVSGRVDTHEGSDGEWFAVAVAKGSVAPSALYVVIFILFASSVLASSVLASELDDGGIGGISDGGRDVTRRRHRERAWLSWSWRQASAIVFQKGRSPTAVVTESSWSGRGEEAETFFKVALVSGLLVKGVDHLSGDGLSFRLNHGGFCVFGCFRGVVVGAGPGISCFFGVKVPVSSGRRASRHGIDARE